MARHRSASVCGSHLSENPSSVLMVLAQRGLVGLLPQAVVTLTANKSPTSVNRGGEGNGTNYRRDGAARQEN